jgi:hypothetical protein
MKNLSPPKWAPYAVATEQGWVNPKTKEVLVSLRGLKSKINQLQPEVVLDIETLEECPVEIAFVEIVTEQSPKIVENDVDQIVIEKKSEEPDIIAPAPNKKGRGRPKANKNI